MAHGKSEQCAAIGGRALVCATAQKKERLAASKSCTSFAGKWRSSPLCRQCHARFFWVLIRHCCVNQCCWQASEENLSKAVLEFFSSRGGDYLVVIEYMALLVSPLQHALPPSSPASMGTRSDLTRHVALGRACDVRAVGTRSNCDEAWPWTCVWRVRACQGFRLRRILIGCANTRVSQVPTYAETNFALTLTSIVEKALRSVDALPGNGSDVTALCALSLRSLVVVCQRKSAALRLVTDGHMDALLTLAVETCGDEPQEWAYVLELILQLGCVVARTLGQTEETIQLVSPSVQGQKDLTTYDMIASLIKYVEGLRSSKAAFRLRGFNKILDLTPTPAVPTAFLNDFRSCDGPEQFVQQLIRSETDCETEVVHSLNRLDGLVAQSSPARVPQSIALQPGYWLLAPQDGKYECQAMVLDILVQAFETVSSDSVANTIIDVLSRMFPARPLFGTSNAIAIFTALRSRFHDFSFNIQAKALELIDALLLVDPTPWLASEFLHLCGLFEGASAMATRLIVAHLKGHASLPEFSVAVCDPLIVHHLVDQLKHAGERCPVELPGTPNSEHDWTTPTLDLLDILGAVAIASNASGRELYFYGTETLLTLMNREGVRESAGRLLASLGCMVDFPALLIKGLVKSCSQFIRRVSVASRVEPEAPSLAQAASKSGDSVVYHPVVHRMLLLTGLDTAELRRDNASSQSLASEEPNVSDVEPECGVWISTCSLSLATILTVLRGNSGAKGCFMNADGPAMLHGVIGMCGETLQEHVADTNPALECFISTLSIVGTLQHQTDPVLYPIEEFRSVCATSKILKSRQPFPALICASLFHLSTDRQFLPPSTQALSKCSDHKLCSTTEELTRTSRYLERAHTDKVSLTATAEPAPRLPPCITNPELIKALINVIGGNVAVGQDARFDELVTCCLDDMLLLLKTNFSNRRIMCENGILHCTLDVMEPVLRDQFHPCHSKVVQIVTILARYSMTGEEVRQFMKLLNRPYFPHTLSKTLADILDRDTPWPRHYIDFNSPDNKGTSTASSHGGELDVRLTNISWPPSHGFTATMWLRIADRKVTTVSSMNVDRPSETVGSSYVYVEGLQNPSAITLFDMRADGQQADHNGAGIIVRVEPASGKVSAVILTSRHGTLNRTPVDLAMDGPGIQPNRWTHLAVTCAPLPARMLRKAESEMTVYIDGIKAAHTGIPSFGASSTTNVRALFNTAPQDCRPDVSFQMGNFFLLRHVVSTPQALLLYAIGPNLGGFNLDNVSLGSMLRQAAAHSAKSGEGADLSPLLLSLLKDKHSLDELGKKIVCFVRPRDGWVFQERCRAPTPVSKDDIDMNLAQFSSGNSAFRSPHAETLRSLGRDNTRVSGARKGPSGQPPLLSFPVLVGQSAITATSCEPVQGNLKPPARVCHRRGLSEAVHDVGGVHILLYLLASVMPVERNQANVLRALFGLVRNSPSNSQSLKNNEGYLLLNNYLRSERCMMGSKIIEVLLEAAVTDPQQPESKIDVSRWGVIINVDLFMHVFLDWRIFDRAPLPAWKMLCNAMVKLVDTNYCHYALLNAHVLRQAGAMRKILFTCQEERTNFPGQITLALVRILYFLMETSENESESLDDMVELINFLVATHPKRNFRARESSNFTASVKREKVPTRSASAGQLLRDIDVEHTPGSGPNKTVSNEHLSISLDMRISEAGEEDLSAIPNMGSTATPPHTPPPLMKRSSGLSPRNIQTPPISPLGQSFMIKLPTPMAIRKRMRAQKNPNSATPPRATHSRTPTSPCLNWLTNCVDDQSASPLAPLGGDSSFFVWWKTAEEFDNNSTSIRLGMIRLLLDRVVNAPQKFAQKIQDAFSVKIVLALADHENAATRVSMIRILDCLLRMPGNSIGSQLSNINGFRLLTNQLRQHSVTEELFVACCDLFTGQTPFVSGEAANFSDLGFGITSKYHVRTLDAKTKDRGVYRGRPDCALVLVSLLDKAVKSAPLCISIVATLHEIFVKRPELRQPIVAANLAATLCDVIRTSIDDVLDITVGADPVSIYESNVSQVREELSYEAAIPPHLDMSDSLESEAAEGMPFHTELQKLLFVHVEAFLIDISEFACSLTKSDPQTTKGLLLIEDLVDCFGSRGLPACYMRHFQVITMQTALDRICTSFTTGNGGMRAAKVKQAFYNSHPAHVLTGMSVDMIISSVGISKDENGSVVIETRTEDISAPFVQTSSPQKPAGQPDAPETPEAAPKPQRLETELHARDHFGLICETFHVLRSLVLGSDMSAMELSELAALQGTTYDSLIDQLGNLVLFLLHPTQPYRFAEFTIGILATYIRLIDKLADNVAVYSQIFLSVYDFYKMLPYGKQGVHNDQVQHAMAIMSRMVRTREPLIKGYIDFERSQLGPKTWFIEVKPLIASRRQNWLVSLIDRKRELLHERGEVKDNKLQAQRMQSSNADFALDLTSVTIEAQDEHKKRALQEVQAKIQTDARIRTRWRQLGESVSQPRAIWANVVSDAVWILDPTEGPQRMRMRLSKTEVVGSWATVGRSPMPGQDEADAAALAAAAAADAAAALVGEDDAVAADDAEAADGESGAVELAAESPLKSIFEAMSGYASEVLEKTNFLSLAELPEDDAYGACHSLLEGGHLKALQGGESIMDKSTLAQLYAEGYFGKLHEQGLSRKACVGKACAKGVKAEYKNSTCGCWACIDCLRKTQGLCPSCHTKQNPFEKQSSIDYDPIKYLTARDVDAEDEVQGLAGGLQPGERLMAVYSCKLVSPFGIKAGELLIGRDAFYFKEDPNQPASSSPQLAQPRSITVLGTLSRDPAQLPYWPNSLIQEVHDRRYLLQRNSLEVFLINGTTILIAFGSTGTRDEARKQLLSLDLPNYVDYSNTVNGSMTRDSITQQWVKGVISNFEYLMHINKLAGRSFNDLTQYPVLPYVLQDYSSKKLDLDNPRSYRDLTKPMGAQDPERLKKFQRKYGDLLELQEQPYHYGSHYSSVGSVLHYLVRTEPFTQLFLELQGGKFDFADRTFFSIQQAWNLSSKISPADVKELTPEFFYLPEFLLNLNDAPFGETQGNHFVNNVLLPPWAKGSARRFIRMHRRALESDYVSSQLNSWIDLIFGSKQKGEQAAKAFNMFLPLSYEGTADIEATEDPIEREAQWGIVRSFGQTPKQLLTRPHSARVAKTARFSFWGQEHMRAVVMWHRSVTDPVHQIYVTKSNEVLVLGPCKALISAPTNNFFVMWGMWDDAFHVCSLDTGKEISTLKSLHDDRILCVSIPQDNTLMVAGGIAGLVSVYRFVGDRKHPQLEPVASLPGHSGAITAVSVSRSLSIIVSGSEDRTAIIWDLNRLSFVRSIEPHEGPISSLAISDCTGDIVTVCCMPQELHMLCKLRLWSVNATLVATVTSDTYINCVTVSSLKNGVSENVVVAGLEDGSIMLWESLDLAPIIKLSDPRFTAPVVSVRFTDATTIITGTQGASSLATSRDARLACARPPLPQQCTCLQRLARVAAPLHLSLWHRVCPRTTAWPMSIYRSHSDLPTCRPADLPTCLPHSRALPLWRRLSCRWLGALLEPATLGQEAAHVLGPRLERKAAQNAPG